MMEGEHTGEPLGRLEVLVLMEIKGQAEPLSTETPIPHTQNAGKEFAFSLWHLSRQHWLMRNSS